jgi:hypothetical protein
MKIKRWLIVGLITAGILASGVATAQLVNTLVLNGSATGVAPSLQAKGGDANISINLKPKGTGVVQVNGTPIALSGGTITSLAISPGPLTVTGPIQIAPGTSGVLENLGGAILSNTSTDVTTTQVGVETDLFNFSVPGNTLSANNQYLKLDFFMQEAATANAKQIRAYFGATTICDSTNIVFNGSYFKVSVLVYRTGAATQKVICHSTNGAIGGAWNAAGGQTAILNSTPAETLTGAVVLRVTATDAVAIAGSTLKAANLYWYPAGQ